MIIPFLPPTQQQHQVSTSLTQTQLRLQYWVKHSYILSLYSKSVRLTTSNSLASRKSSLQRHRVEAMRRLQAFCPPLLGQKLQEATNKLSEMWTNGLAIGSGKSFDRVVLCPPKHSLPPRGNRTVVTNTTALIPHPGGS